MMTRFDHVIQFVRSIETSLVADGKKYFADRFPEHGGKQKAGRRIGKKQSKWIKEKYGNIVPVGS
ncbi:Hypothetical predicted protein, partial [Paramuricea clavata]